MRNKDELRKASMINQTNRPASALLLTVMIIAILSSTTLASIAVRFDQLSSTDKIANSAIAKSAADSGLAKLKESLSDTGTVSAPTIYDLETNEVDTTSLSTTTNYRPSPKKIVSTYEKTATSLPRCLAVAVLSSWVNDGKYLFSDAQSSNPALIFNYANIVNDTPLGIIPGNTGLSTDDQGKTLSNFTNMGHFYNPYAPVGSIQSDLSYWTLKLGGPNDQFMTRKSNDGTSSYYKELDFVYLPYLPRFQDSGIKVGASGTGLERLTADQLRTKFENVIKDNNFRVWLDASVDDSMLSQYGFGDLFSGSSEYKLNWLQPSIWNDTPEAELMTPYITSPDAGTINWSKQPQVPKVTTSASSGWNTSIIKGAKSFSFIKLSTSDNLEPGDTRSGLLFGSLEGLRLNQKITLTLLNKSSQPLTLNSRSLDQGRLYNAILTQIGPKTVSNNIESMGVTFTLSSAAFDTPTLLSGAIIKGSDVDTIAIQSNPQFSTSLSNSSVTIEVANGLDVSVSLSSSPCTPIATTFTACPAVGDLVSFTKAGSAPLWGKVKDVVIISSGTRLDKIIIDKLRESPKPVREMAYSVFTATDGSPRVAYYGGAIAMNDYDGGYASESNELWIYNPAINSWTYPAASGTSPGFRAGASMVFDSQNRRLVVVGGYYHQWINASTAGVDCEINQPTCLYTNRPGLRIAKRVTNDTYVYTIASDTTGSWEKITYPLSNPEDKIQDTSTYTIRTTSTLADRSGLEGWNVNIKNDPDAGVQSIYVDGGPSQITVSPSVAGLAVGDQVYITGIKNVTNESFYAWGRIDVVAGESNTVQLVAYGYKPKPTDVVQNYVDLTSFSLQVTKRQDGVTSCTGGVTGVSPKKYFCTLSDNTGFSVGDSVVLEEYSANSLINVLTGYIAFLTVGSKAYFVSNENNSNIKDFSDFSAVSSGLDNESPVKLPTMRYGANLSSRAIGGGVQKNAYSQGAAKNINNYNRIGDIWDISFTNGVTGGAASVPWTLNPIDTDPAKISGTFNFQIIRSQSFHQFSTTSSVANNPEVKKTKAVLDRDGNPTDIFEWDNSQYWKLEIDSSSEPKLSVGARVTLEKRSETGARLTWHGIIPEYFVAENSNGQCGAPTSTKLCLKHDSNYPNDSEFTSSSDQTANTKVSVYNWTSTESHSGSGTWNQAQGYFQLTSPTNYSLIPPVGTTIMLWSTGSFPIKAYTITVKNRAFIGGNPNVFRFTPTGSSSLDKMLPSPPQNAFMTTALATNSGSDIVVTMADHLLQSDGLGAPEWFAPLSSPAEWKVRLAAKNAINDRPSPRKAGAIASISTTGAGASTKFYEVGGTLGSLATLWRQTASGQTATNLSAWTPRYVSGTLTSADLPNMAGGSLVAYNDAGTDKLIWLGGKQKTDFSSKDYGQGFGPIMLGRPDIDRAVTDGSFYMDDSNGGKGVASASTWAFTHAIESNLPGDIPGGAGGNIAKSLSFRAGGILSYNSGTVCAYLGQSANCSTEQLMSNLGMLGRIDGRPGSEFGGVSWGKTNIISSIGTKFLSSNGTELSLILSAPSFSGTTTNGRWDQDGYRPYLCDKAAEGFGLDGSGCSTPVGYGQLATNLTSDKTAVISAFSKLQDGGAILVTTNGIGKAIASNRGGKNSSTGRWYSYCAKSDTKIENDVYVCKSDAKRFLPTLPDPEDVLFTLNAALALSSVDTYKVVGYYGGIKRGYQVISRNGAAPVVYEIVP